MKATFVFCLLLVICSVQHLRAECLAAPSDSLLLKKAYASGSVDSAQWSGHISKDLWLARDKFYHLTASVILTGICFEGYDQMGFGTAQARTYAVLSALAVGILKEERDRHRSYFSWKDLVADILGIGLGVLVFTY